MAVHTQWGNDERTIIHRIYEGAWTWQEDLDTTEQVTALLDTVAHRVDFIFDLRSASHIPLGTGSQLSRSDPAPYFSHPNAGVSVVLGTTLSLRIIIPAVIAAQPALQDRLLLAETLEEAHALIANARAADESSE